jgi:D-alanyl-lipoteichoic acid acyltransferase DltB (MBOAT superfamily)
MAMSSVAATRLPEARPEADVLRATTRLLGLAAQLGLALLLIRQFQVESRTFFHVAVLAAAGFVVHALLPLRHRLPFFACLSLASVWVAFGVRDGAWLLAIGAALIGICHLPVRFAVRIALLVAAAVALAAVRARWLPAPWQAGVWPILGSMFMFRLALYLHALRHDEHHPTLARTFAYFFMLPNVCFPLFPVVDYTTFARSHYDADPHTTYQTGVTWIVRGLVHLLLYRLVYTYLAGDPTQLTDLGDLTRYLLATFLLYLRISGQFHLIVGMLYLFGFRLPETHRLYYLASSFTDFWRRINIYWKDFMMKLVYYPSFFRLRRWGGTVALVGATLVVFVVTWLLHSYQWFWILGRFPITLQDVLFWGVLGVLVLANALYEARRGRRRTLGKHRWSAALALRTVGTFCTICVLWSLWSTESVAEWVAMWRVASRADTGDVLLLVGLLAFGLAIAGRNWAAPTLRRDAPLLWWRQPAVRTTATLLALLALGQPAVYGQLGASGAAVLASLQRNSLNAREEALRHKGYYEQLDAAPRFEAQLWQENVKRPTDWVPFSTTTVYHRRRDFLASDLAPSTSIIYHGEPFTTNRWGMRDRDYELAKPPGTIRVAMLGPSHVMGAGVADGESFEALLEERLNREGPGAPDRRYEVLNFAGTNYSILQELAMLDERAFGFQPDVVVVTAYTRLNDPLTTHLVRVVERGIPVPYPGLDSILHRAGVDRRLPRRENAGRIRLAADTIVTWSLRRIADESRRRGAVPVMIVLDNPDTPRQPRLHSVGAAADAGFLVLNLLDVFGPGDQYLTFRQTEWDSHPTAAGHRRIADRLFDDFRRNAVRLRLASPTATPENEHSLR